ncbi:alpha-galactosidase [Paenibacillus sp. HJL G12]|uniref:Alpha-galactosidase n=1 Tax=Paenibacillus dendrobii TaxID=2691084 RepID=A0A7X3IHE9_9BACL|nr:alpha-galactosidase [Paenibacillus dendrobii]MWV43992.1 alpha-galactosidase [Paenibacillus dendrobii]
MPIISIPERKAWVLRTHHVDYVIGVDKNGALQHLYWGEKLALSEDYPEADSRQTWIWETDDGNSREETMPWGRRNFAEPGLKVEFADRTRDLVLQFTGAHIENNMLQIDLLDGLKSLQVTASYRLFDEFDLIERSLAVNNKGDGPVCIEQVMSAIWHFPVYPSYRLTYLTGHWGAETQLRREVLHEGKKVIEARRGITGHNNNPFFAVDFGEAAEESGLVYFGGLAFSGHWKMVAERTPYQTLQLAAGIHDFDFRWLLQPGEAFNTPVCVGGYTAGGFGDASRKLHGYQQKYVLRNGGELRKILYNSWEATYFDVNEENQKQLAEKAAKLGVERFVVDDGWFGKRNDDNAGLGDWYVNKTKFPNGLTPLIDYVKSLGMDFGIWIEPEMVNPDSDLYRLHPDWVYHFPDRPRTEGRNQLVLNLARDDVRTFVYQAVEELLSTHEISFIKWDMNRYFSEPGWPSAEAGRDREIWVRHVHALYDIWQRLQDKHPHVQFESCAGGGGRVDMGIMRFADQFWTSDNTDALDRLRIQWGYSHAYNSKSMVCWVTETVNYMNGRRIPLKFRFHSAMMGTLGIGMDLNQLSPQEMEEAAGYVAQYKQIRPIVQEGLCYRLSPPEQSDLTSMQYVGRDGQEAAVFVFRHAQHFGHPALPVRPRGLEPFTRYRNVETGEVRSGQAWMSRGILLELTGDYDSALIRLYKMN